MEFHNTQRDGLSARTTRDGQLADAGQYSSKKPTRAYHY